MKHIVLVAGVLIPLIFTIPGSGLLNSPRSISASGTIRYPDSQQIVKVKAVGNRLNVPLYGIAIPGDATHEAVPIMTENDIRWIKEHGFNYVRLCFSWTSVEKSEGVYDANALAKQDQIISWCEKYGVYVIVNCHIWGSHLTGWGAFPSFYVTQYSDSRSVMEDFCLRLTPNGQRMRNAFSNMWKYVASRYKGRNIIAGYCLFNEPYNNILSYRVSEWLPAWVNYMDEELGPAIRSVDSETMLIYNVWAGYTSYVRGPALPNVAYGDSYYEGAYTSWNPTPYDRNAPHPWESGLTMYQGMEKHVASRKSYYVDKLGMPFINLESGSSSKQDNNQQWLDDVLKLFNKYGLYWTYWWYAPWTTDGMSPVESEGTENAPLVNLLVSNIP